MSTYETHSQLMTFLKTNFTYYLKINVKDTEIPTDWINTLKFLENSLWGFMRALLWFIKLRQWQFQVGEKERLRKLSRMAGYTEEMFNQEKSILKIKMLSKIKGK